MFADDAVALRPVWSALLSSGRFARRTTWTFGTGAGRMECTETRFGCDAGRPLDPLRVRFDVRRWAGAFVRSAGSAREISVVADDGDEIARLRLDVTDPALDELIWRLMSDDPAVAPSAADAVAVDEARLADELALAPTLGAFDAIAARARLTRERTLELAGADVARRLVPSAFSAAAQAALAAGLPLRVHLRNSGVGVTWTPAGDVVVAPERTLHAGRVAVAVGGGTAPAWAVELTARERCCPAIERSARGERGWLRLDVASENDRTCAIWRRICATLEENP
jgi:hypothetical protein